MSYMCIGLQIKLTQTITFFSLIITTIIKIGYIHELILYIANSTVMVHKYYIKIELYT